MPRTGVVGLIGPQDYATMILADGPVGYWRLGEASGSVADSSPSGTTLAPSGAPTYGLRGGLPLDPNGAVLFDGVTSYFSAVAPAALKLATVVTVEAWIKTSNPSALGVILRLGSGADEYYSLILGITQVKRIGFQWYDGSFRTVNGNTDIAGGWTHVAATRDANGVITMYLNGRADGGGASTVPSVSPTTLTIGSSGSGQFFPGIIDEVAIYPTVLSPQRIVQHYQAGLAALRPAADYRSLIASDNPAGYWRLGDSGSVAADQTGVNNGAFNGGVTKGAPGVIADGDPAVSFDGATGFVSVPTMPTLQGGATRTIELWLRSSLASTTQQFFDCGNASSPGLGLSFVVTKQGAILWGGAPGGNVPGLYLALGSGDDIYLPGLAADGLWHHVAVVISANGTQVRAFVDGQQPSGYLWNGATWTGLTGPPFSPPAPANTTGNPIWFGQGRVVASGWALFFTGTLDEVAIYPYALSAAQVLQHYQTGLRAA